MAAPNNEFAFDLAVAREAAEHWQRRSAERGKKLKAYKDGRYDAVEPKARLALRVNRLLGKVRTAVPEDRRGLSEGLKTLVDRPPVNESDVTNDFFERVIGETRDFLSIEFLEQGVQANRSVARVVTPLGNNRRSYASGFMVSPRLFLTNHHVFRSAQDAAGSTLEFNYQRDRQGQATPVRRFALDPDAFFLNDKALDFALVAVTDVTGSDYRLADFAFCPLIGDEGKISVGECINIIQHPRGEMKQVVIRENKLLDLADDLGPFAHYEADTERGSSGSPVFNDQWEVVALHHTSIPKSNAQGNLLDLDGKVWREGDDPDRLEWVANEGIRVSRLVKFFQDAAVREHEKALRDELLAQPPSNDGAPQPVKAPGAAERVADPVPVATKTGELTMSTPTSHAASALRLPDGAVTVTIPLTITVSLGTAQTAESKSAGTTPTGSPSLGEVAAEISIQPDPDYHNRPGYDPDFAGFPAPLPTLTNTIRGDAATVRDTDEIEIKYHHYSVILNGKRRVAFVSAVNLDADAAAQYQREGGDRWFYDPRIGKEFQAGNEFYSNNPLDRGHLTRRADAAWGADDDEAKLANDDTFHFTNCSPQHEVFNQSSKATRDGLLLWGNLENHVAAQAKASNKKLCVFNGPVFRDSDRPHRGLKVPREFYKIVAFRSDDGKPRVAAFVLSQADLIQDLPQEDFEIGEFRPFQVKVRDVESKTKLDFGKLRTFDALDDHGNESFFESGTEAIALKSLTDVVL